MPYCTECGSEADKTDYYCGQCGSQLDEEHGTPIDMTSNSVGSGFLSRESVAYVAEAVDSGIDKDQPGHAALHRDIAASLQDFAIVGTIEEINLLDILASELENEDSNDKEHRLMLLGLFRLARLYDQSFATEWEAELSENLTESIQRAKEHLKEEQR